MQPPVLTGNPGQTEEKVIDFIIALGVQAVQIRLIRRPSSVLGCPLESVEQH